MWERMNRGRESRPKKWVPAVLAASCIAIGAVPVIAAETLNWNWFLGINSSIVTNAFKAGLGQQVMKVAGNETVEVTLMNMVTDAGQTTINYTLTPLYSGSYDQAMVDDVRVMDAAGDLLGVGGAKWHQGIKKLVGSVTFATKQGLVTEGEHHSISGELTFSLGKLTLLKEEQIILPVDVLHMLESGETLHLQDVGPSIPTMENFYLEREGEIITVHYRLARKELEENQSQLAPKIELLTGEDNALSLGGMLFPSTGTLQEDGGNRYRGRFLVPREQSLQAAKLAVRYMEVVQEVPAGTSVAFDIGTLPFPESVDHGWTQSISGTVAQDRYALHLEELIVSPLSMRLTATAEKLPTHEASTHYTKVWLELGGVRLKGYPEYSNHIPTGYRFELPREFAGLFTDLTGNQLRLKWEEPVNTYRAGSRDQLRISRVGEEKKETVWQVAGYPLRVKYWKEGSDLYIQTWSEDPAFVGITQTLFVRDTELIFPKRDEYESESLEDGGMVERFVGAANGDETNLVLQPYAYKLLEPAKSVELELEKAP